MRNVLKDSAAWGARLAGGTAMLLTLTACPTDDAVTRGQRTTETLLADGWECLKAPNSLDQPGLVFRVSSDGTRFDGTVLDVPVRPGTVADASFEDSGKVSASLVASMLGLDALNTDAKGEGSASREFTAKVKLEDRKEQRTLDGDIIAAITELDTGFVVPDNQYYIIRDTQLAKKQTLTVDRKVAAKLGGEAEFENSIKATAKASIERKRDQVYEIKQEFPEYLTVCIKAEKFDPNLRRLGAGGAVLDPKLKGEYWEPSAE
jgi:hypothetical protein